MNEDIVELALETLDHHDVLYRMPKRLAAKGLPLRFGHKSRPDSDTASYGSDVRRRSHHEQDDRYGDRYDGRRDEKRNDRPTNDPRGLYAQRGRRASSFDNGDYGRGRRSDRDPRGSVPAHPPSLAYGSRCTGHSRDYYESESSVSPRRRNRHRGRERSNSVSRSSSSSLISSTEDERQRRKVKIKDLVGAGLAAVATINAASGLYSSMDAMKTRHRQVKEGKLSRKEARRLKNTAKVHDLAAVGVAALSIKSVYSRWKETRETHQGYHEYLREKERRHHKRLEQR